MRRKWLCFLIILPILILWLILPINNKRDSTCQRHVCNHHGTCLLGKCFCWAGYVGVDCTIRLKYSLDFSCVDNDKCFIHPIYGIGEISQERWQKARSAEQAIWIKHRGSNDRWIDHLVGFDYYKKLPVDLGSMIEIGCGPYTQTLSILRLKYKHVQIHNLTLLDPNADVYMKQVKQCSYINGSLKRFEFIPTTIITGRSEDMDMLVGKFDTVLMVNVLEHVQNAYKILQNIYNALRVDGLLIFAERWWDDFVEDRKSPYEELHPIRIRYSVWKWFTDHFISIYDARNHHSFTTYGHNGSYFIGRKKKI